MPILSYGSNFVTNMSHWHLETLGIHAGQSHDPQTGSATVPLYMTAAYQFESPEQAAALFELREFGNIYTRITNPTTAVFEQRMAAIEGGAAALAVSSGSSAILLTVLNLTNPGDEIVSANNLYGGTYQLFTNVLPMLGRSARFVDPADPENFRKAITDKTKALYVETIGNPALFIPDFEAIAAIAREAGVPLVADNTVAAGLFRPLEYGADIAVLSATKYVGGHGRAVGGVIVESGKFHWNEKFPMFRNPEPSYHGLVYQDAFGNMDGANIAFMVRARTIFLRDMGMAISPFNSWLFLQGLETLALRMREHSANALTIARGLAENSLVEWVNYPGLPGHPAHERALRYMPRGQSGLLGFAIRGDGKKFIGNLKLLKHMVNIGDVRTIVTHPASTTHQQMSPEDRHKAGIDDNYIRLSVGLENTDDVLADIEQALQ